MGQVMALLAEDIWAFPHRFLSLAPPQSAATAQPATYLGLAKLMTCLQAKAAQQVVDHVLESGGVCISCQHRSCLELKQQEPTIRYAPPCC